MRPQDYEETLLPIDEAPSSQRRPQEWIARRVGMVFFFPALGGLLFGYDIGATSYVVTQLQDSEYSGVSWHQQLSNSSFLQGAITSAGVGGAFLGSLVVFSVTEAMGTRREMLLASLLFVCGALIEALAATSSLSSGAGEGILLLGRWTYGIGCGFAMHGAPSYIAEMSPPDVRGTLVSLKEAMVVLGMLLGYLIGWANSTTPGGWKWTYAAAVLPAAAMFLGILFTLSSPPRWLLGRGLKEEAWTSAAFVYVHREEAADAIIAELIASAEATEATAAALAAATVAGQSQGGSTAVEASQSSGRGGVVKEAADGGGGSSAKPPLFVASNRRALVAGLGVVTLQQVTGQPSILYYAAGIFKAAGIESYAAVLTGAFKLAMTMLSVVVVDKYGRRWLLFVGISIMLAALVVLTLAFHGYEPVDDDDRNSSDSDGLTARTLAIVLGMFLFIGGYQVSFGPIAWLLISEVFALDVRDAAIAVAVQTNFFWNLVVSFGYPTLVAGMGAIFGERDQYTAAFGLFLLLTAYSLYFVHQYVPETKGLSLLEIESLFKADHHPESNSSACNAFCGGTPRDRTHQRGSGSIARSLQADSPSSHRRRPRSNDSGTSKTMSTNSEATYDRMA